MSQDEIRKLVGGYATGTLTEAERKALFAAALDDQDLFDELAREQSLKELLDSPGARTHLTAVLTPPAPRWSANRLRFAIFGTLAAGFAIALGIVVVVRKPHTEDLAVVTKTESRPAVDEPSKVIPNPAPAASSSAPALAAPRQFSPPPRSQAVNNSIAPLPPPVLLQPPPEDALKKIESARRDEPAKSDAARPAQGERGAAAKAADEKDTAPQSKAQTAQAAESVTVQTETAELQTQALPVQQVPSGLARQQAAAPKAAPAPPPAVAANNGAIGGLTASRLAGLAARPAPTRFAFDYTIRRDSLTVNPRAAGYLQVTAAVSGGQQVVLQQPSRQEAGTSVTMPIPAGSLNLTIEFSASPPIQDVAASLDNLQNSRFREKTAVVRANAPATPAAISKEKTGHLEEQTATPVSRLSITVAVPAE